MHLVTAIIKAAPRRSSDGGTEGRGRHRYDDRRRAGFRSPTWTHRGVPRVGVQRRLPAQGAGRRPVRRPDADKITDVIADAARTGKIGDGKIWVTEVAPRPYPHRGDGKDAL